MWFTLNIYIYFFFFIFFRLLSNIGQYEYSEDFPGLYSRFLLAIVFFLIYSLVFWPREFHGSYSPWGCKESDRTDFHSFTFTTLIISLSGIGIRVMLASQDKFPSIPSTSISGRDFKALLTYFY